MKLIERHIIKPNDTRYEELRHMLHLSKNLYNAGLYKVRQYFFQVKDDSTVKYKYLNYYALAKEMAQEHNEDFYALCSNAAQNTLKQIDYNFKSFFSLLSLKQRGKYFGKVQLPKYLPKDGYYQICLNVVNLSIKLRQEGYLQIPNTSIKFGSFHALDAKQLRIVPCNGYIAIEVIYDKQENEEFKDNKRYMSIDLGINNLCTCASNVIKAFIVDGKKIKHINQHWNKSKAELQSRLKQDKNEYTSKQIQTITRKRNFRIDSIFHKVSRYIVNQAVENQINTIVIGKNNGWKQETNLGKKNNQNFVQIPFNKLIQKIYYKAQLFGIRVVTQEESYTSKASYFDDDFIPTYGQETEKTQFKFSGKRIKRGLYKTSNDLLINADVNGSLNILKKYLINQKCNCDSLKTLADGGLVVRPFRVKFLDC